MKNFKTTPVTTSIKNVEQHEILNRFGRRKLDQYFKKEMKRYGTVNLPVAIQDKVAKKYVIISNWELIEQSRLEGKNQIALTVIDCSIGEAPRLYNYVRDYKQKRDYRELYDLITYLKDHMQNTPDGKEWKEDMGGTLRQNIANLIGYKDSMITHIETIAKYCPDLLDSLTQGEITWTAALESVKKIRAKHEKQEIKKKTNPSTKTDKAPAELKSLLPTFGKPTVTNHTGDFTTTSSNTGLPQFNSTSTPPPVFSNSGLPEFFPKRMELKIEGFTDVMLEFIDGQITKATLNEKAETDLTLKFIPGKENHLLNFLRAGNSILSITINQSLLK